LLEFNAPLYELSLRTSLQMRGKVADMPDLVRDIKVLLLRTAAEKVSELCAENTDPLPPSSSSSTSQQ
jgi:hypothetical protein